MKQRSSAALRAKQNAPKKFVPALHWYGKKSLPAVGLVVDKDSSWPENCATNLKPLRNVISEIILYPDFAKSHDFLLIMFTIEQLFEVDRLRSFIPLQWDEERRLTNLTSSQAIPNNINIRSYPNLHILWLGSRHDVSKDHARQLNKLALWETPDVTLCEPISLPQKTGLTVPAVDGRSKTWREKLSRETETKTFFADQSSPFKDLELKVNNTTKKRDGAPIFSFNPFRWFRQHALGEGGNRGTQTSVGQYRQGYQIPLFERLRGWLNWHTPVGQGLRRKYEQRLDKVQRLLRSGDVDEALKWAVAMATKDATNHERRRKYLPATLPPPRVKLDFSIDQSGWISPILSSDMHYDLLQSYRQVAETLIAKADYRRAAFIHSKLLGNHSAAVEALRRGEHFEEAARLALQSQQSAETIIHLYYLAGKLEEAVALAKRFDCFSHLAATSRKKDVIFYRFVISSWAEQLVNAAQWRKAFEISDELATLKETSDVVQQLLFKHRLDWLKAAVGAEETLDPALLANALLFGNWKAEDAQKFTTKHLGDESSTFGQKVFQTLRDWCHESTEENAQNLTALTQELSRAGSTKRNDQIYFWDYLATGLVDPIIRHVVSNQHNGLSVNLGQQLKALASQSGLDVIAEDLRRLGTLKSTKKGKQILTYEVKRSSVCHPVATCGAIMHGEQLLVWRANGQLELLDKNGSVRWSTQMQDVCGIVQIGDSPFALIIQDVNLELQGKTPQRRLVRFNILNREIFDFGMLDLRVWHDVATVSQWIVQIEQKIGGLDLARLLSAKTPEIAFTWNAQLPDQFKVLGFYINPSQQISWLTQDHSPHSYGMLEIWKYSLRSNSVDVYAFHHDAVDYRPTVWIWLNDRGFHCFNSPELKGGALWVFRANGDDRDVKRKLQDFIEAGGLWTPHIMSADLERDRIYQRLDKGQQKQVIEIRSISNKEQGRIQFSQDIKLHPLCVSSDNDKSKLFAVSDGRLLLISKNNKEIRIL